MISSVGLGCSCRWQTPAASAAQQDHGRSLSGASIARALGLHSLAAMMTASGLGNSHWAVMAEMAGPVSSRRRRRWLAPAVAVGAALSLVAGLFAGVQLLAAKWGPPPASSVGKPIPVHVVQGHKIKVPPMQSWHRPATSWPAAASGTAVMNASASPARNARTALAGPSAGSGRAGTLPVWIGPPDTAASQAPVKVPRRKNALTAASAAPRRPCVHWYRYLPVPRQKPSACTAWFSR